MRDLLLYPARLLFSALFFCGLLPTLSAQSFFEFPSASPFNQKVVQPPDSAWSYSFLAGGHLYGAHTNAQSVYPAASFLGNLKRINANPLEMFISLGDLLRTSGDPKVIAATRTATAGLNMAVFNAPGNHDVSDRAAYEAAFSPARNTFFAKNGDATTHFGWFIKNDYYLLLDSELLLEDRADQVEKFVNKELKRVQDRKTPVRNMFVFSHRLLWALCDESLTPADELANEPLRNKVDQASTCALVEKIEAFPHEKSLYWLSGDVGADWSVPLIYAKKQDKNVHYIATGIGDQPDDALLKVTISNEGKVRLKAFPLTDQKWEAVENYTLAYWAKQPRPASAGGDAIGDKVGRMLGGKAFWIGIVGGLLVGIAGLSLLRRKK